MVCQELSTLPSLTVVPERSHVPVLVGPEFLYLVSRDLNVPELHPRSSKVEDDWRYVDTVVPSPSARDEGVVANDEIVQRDEGGRRVRGPRP